MRILFILMLLTTVGCSTYSDNQKSSFDKEIEAYLKKKKIKCDRTDSGVYFKTLKEGEGRQIQYNDLVSFKYKGELLNGNVFDNHKKPVEFKVKELIGAWKELVLEMKNGGKVFMVVPPHRGYGDYDLNDIPPNSILVFELEVVDVK
jgi:FKBP-type peptidyl-prolyl cis-trans isomerase